MNKPCLHSGHYFMCEASFIQRAAPALLHSSALIIHLNVLIFAKCGSVGLYAPISRRQVVTPKLTAVLVQPLKSILHCNVASWLYAQLCCPLPSNLNEASPRACSGSEPSSQSPNVMKRGTIDDFRYTAYTSTNMKQIRQWFRAGLKGSQGFQMRKQ